MNNAYAPCLCGSGKKFKFCCHEIQKKEGTIPTISNSLPIYECKILKHWEQSGMSPVYVTKELARDSYIMIGYVVDFWCLGVKNTQIKMGISKTDLKNTYNRNNGDLETISYQDARSLIIGAVDFAKATGIAPHSSWKGTPSTFVEAHLAFEKKFSFGQNGKPYYVSGPYDNELYDVEEIISKVSKAKGEFVHMLT